MNRLFAPLTGWAVVAAIVGALLWMTSAKSADLPIPKHHHHAAAKAASGAGINAVQTGTPRSGVDAVRTTVTNRPAGLP